MAVDLRTQVTHPHIEHFQTDANPLDATEVQIPSWVDSFSVQARGVDDIRVATSGTDGAAIGAEYIEVLQPSGIVKWSRRAEKHALDERITSFFIASPTASVDVVVVLETDREGR